MNWTYIKHWEHNDENYFYSQAKKEMKTNNEDWNL